MAYRQHLFLTLLVPGCLALSSSPATGDDLSDTFKAADVNHDGRLDLQEFLRPAEGKGLPGGPRARRADFFRADRDEDGNLDLAEFSRPHAVSDVAARNSFMAADANGDGAVDIDEYLAMQGPKAKASAKRTFHVLDKGDDGRLDLDEFSMIPGAVRASDRIMPDDRNLTLFREQLRQFRESLRARGDGAEPALPVDAWQSAEVGSISHDLVGLSGREWDRDGDGRITEQECRETLEVAHGFRTASGVAIRATHGLILNLVYAKDLDKNKNDFVETSEFVDNYWAGRDKSAALFRQCDANADGRLSLSEIAGSPILYVDPARTFFEIDQDLDGKVSPDELSKKAAKFQREIASRTVPAFDEDRDGGLSLYEYLSTPLANPAADFYKRRDDSDNNGKLSFDEFYTERFPFAVETARDYFQRFDRDHDGSLGPAEFDFKVELDKVPAEAAFRSIDKDHDGGLSLSETFPMPKPAANDALAVQRYEERLARAENRFMANDRNGDGALSLEEFTAAREERLAAAKRGHGPTGMPSAGDLRARRPLFVANALLLAAAFVGVTIYQYKRDRSAPRGGPR